MREQALFVVISSPSGTGKTTIARRLLKKHPEFMKSISFTTRHKRKGERDGKDYTFLGKETFLKRVKKGELVEWAEVYGNYYGTPRSMFRKALKEKKVLLLVLDVQGGMQIKRKYPQSVLVFVLPPTLAELKRRLKGRGAETRRQLDLRLKAALKEIRFWSNYDYIVVNRKLSQAVKSVESIVWSELHRKPRFDFKRWKKRSKI